MKRILFAAVASMLFRNSDAHESSGDILPGDTEKLADTDEETPAEPVAETSIIPEAEESFEQIKDEAEVVEDNEEVMAGNSLEENDETLPA